MNWIYLSKNGTDEYINMMAKGAGVEPTPLETWRYEDNQNPLVLRGILKYKIMQKCWRDNRKFLYMDSGYFGNRPNPLNPHGWKVWHRIVPDNFQHGDIIDRPADRWEKLKIQLLPRQHGRKILIAAPDEKPCQVYGIDLAAWMNQTLTTIKRFTDRPIEVRERNKNRRVRLNDDFTNALKDVHAVVTFNSNAATEAIMAGIPAFVLAPCSAALPVANSSLDKIENPFYPDSDLLQSWCRHLAYGQFHNTELANGMAARITQDLVDSKFYSFT